MASAQAAIVAAQLRVLSAAAQATGDRTEYNRLEGLAAAIEGQVEKVVGEGGALDQGFDALAAGFGLSLDKEFAKLFGKDSSITQGVNTTLAAAAGAASVDPESREEQVTVSLQIVRKTFEDFGNMMEEMFGENGKVIGALSNLLIRVVLKSILSTEPSATPSTFIQSPCLNRFSPIIRSPPIRFLKKFCAPSASATEKSPKPAIIEAASIPQSSSPLTIPNRYMTNLRPLKTQFLNVLERKLYFSPT